jgi:hypothetical protein
MHPKTKYWLYAVSLTIVVAIVIAVISYEKDQKRIEATVIENLNLNHELSLSSVTGNFDVLVEEVSLLARIDRIKNYLIHRLDNKKGSSNIESDFSQWARTCVKHFEFYDFFVINAKGDVIYTVAKEEDLGTNLVNGPYTSSGLGKLFAETKKSEKSAFVDFSIYEPSKSKLAAFFGAPVFVNNKFAGLVAIQLIPSFKELNIGVHIEGIEDYLVSSKYIFQNEGSYKSLDSLSIAISEKHLTLIRNDSLFVFTPFDLGKDLNWGILSVAPPVVFLKNIDWVRIWFHVILAILLSVFISVFIISRLGRMGKGFNYMESDIVLVQNTWHQFMVSDQSFGTDFYYRVKNKINLKLGKEDLNIDEIGKRIEIEASDLVNLLNDNSEIHRKLSFWAEKCLEFNIPASKLLKIPDLFIESFEDEMKKEIHIRAKMAWQKILRSLVYQLVGLLKEKSKK